MKVLTMVLAILAVLLLFSTVVCGLWLRYSGEVIEESSRQFHMVIGLAAALTSVAAIGLSIWRG